MCEAGGTDETGVAKIGENGEIPLYCSRPGVRLIISLLDGDEHTRYWKLPDAVVDVHQNLGELAKNNGDYERAERELRACIKLAPTSVRFYEELSQVYARTDEYGKAADVLIGALKIAVLPIDCEVLYYRLGYALWQLGRLPEALACYAMMVNGGTPFRTAARDEAEEVSRQMGLPSPDMKYGGCVRCAAIRRRAGCAGRQGVRYDCPRRDLPDGCWFPATGSGCGLDAWNARWR